MLDEKDIHWAAGFLEGEGSFGFCNCSIKVQCSQTFTSEPLEKLQRIFGGEIYRASKAKQRANGSGSQDTSVWQVTGEKALFVMFSILPLMSGRRKDKINAAIRDFLASSKHAIR